MSAGDSTEELRKVQEEIAHFQQKYELQKKRIAFLKAENEELKDKQANNAQRSEKIKKQNDQLKRRNRELKGQVNEFKLVMQVASKGSGGPRTATVKELVITNNTQEVDLPNHEVTDEDIDQMKGFSGIKTLILGENKITDIGFYTLCTSFSDLRQLFINHNQISDQGTDHIPRLKHLKCLDIRCNKITSEALRNICQLSQLTQLSLSKNAITDENVHLLKQLPELRYLDITSNKLGQKGGLAIAEVTSLHNLYLSNNRVTAECVWKFLDLTELKVLDVRFNALSNEERDVLRANKKGDLQLLL